MDVRRERLHEIARPAAHRGYTIGLWQADAEPGHRIQVPALHEGVDELSRTDHDRGDAGPAAADVLQQLRNRRDHAASDVGRRDALRATYYLPTRHQDGIGVGAADVDPQPVLFRVH